jgi:hypothetical protein
VTPIPRVRWTRETRLLLVTVLLSVSVLLVLARFRFPAQEPLELPAQPLQRLAERAAFDDLSVAVERAAERVRPSLAVVPVAQPFLDTPRSLTVTDVLLQRPDTTEVSPLALACRVRSNASLVLTTRPLGRIGDTLGGALPFTIRARDEVRGLTLLAHQPARDDAWEPLATSTPASPQYLMIAEPAPGGVILRPLFGGVASSFSDPQWEAPLIALGRETRASHGAFVFTIDGALVGGIVNDAGVQAIVPADVLLRAGERLATATPSEPSSIGVRVQTLTASLASLTGAARGALVVEVEAEGPADGSLEPGDVVVAVGGRSVDAPESALLAIAAARPGEPLELRLVRRGSLVAARVVPRPASALAAEGTLPLGLSIRPVRQGSAIERVESGSAAQRAGLRPGDVVTRVDGELAPAPGELRALFEGLGPGQALLVGIERDGVPLMLALSR